jgi:hypothetical protein
MGQLLALHRRKTLADLGTSKEVGSRRSFVWLPVGHRFDQPDQVLVTGTDSFYRIESARGALQLVYSTTFQDLLLLQFIIFLLLRKCNKKLNFYLKINKCQNQIS